MIPLDLSWIRLDSALPGCANSDRAIQYVIETAAKPVPFSAFSRNTREMRRLPRDEWPAWLLARGYNAVIALLPPNQQSGLPRVVGYIAWQRHGDTFHMFAVLVDKRYRGMGIGIELHRKLIEIARRTEGIRHCQLGARPTTLKMMRRFVLDSGFASLASCSRVVPPLRRWPTLAIYIRYAGVNMRTIIAGLEKQRGVLAISVDSRRQRISINN